MACKVRLSSCLLLGLLLVLPLPGTTQEGTAPSGGSSEPASDVVYPESEACSRWKSEWPAMEDRFWNEHVGSWETFAAQMLDQAHRWQASTHSPEEDKAFWNAWWSEVDAARVSHRDTADAHHREMVKHWLDSCGYDPGYAARTYHYPDPFQWESGGAAVGSEPAPAREYTYGEKPVSSAGPEPAPATPAYSYSPECAAFEEERRAAVLALEGRFSAEKDALGKEWSGFQSQPHTPEEWESFKLSMAERERDLRARMEAEFQAVWARYPDKSECYGSQLVYGAEAQAVAPEGYEPCAFDYAYKQAVVYDDRLRSELEEFHRLAAERRARFEERIKLEWQAYESGGFTQDEKFAFQAKLEAEKRAFEERLALESAAFEARMGPQEAAFGEQQQARCLAGTQPSTEPVYPVDQPRPATEFGPAGTAPAYPVAQEELEIARLECELSVQVGLADFLYGQDAAWAAWEAEGSPSRPAFEASMEAARLSYEIEVRRARLECMRALQEKWTTDVGADLAQSRPYERMGSWSMEPADDGRIHLRGKFVSLVGDPATNAMGDIAVQGAVWISRISTDSFFESEGFGMGDEGDGSWLEAHGEGVELRLHDTPNGLIRFRSAGPFAILLTVPDHVTVEEADHGWALETNGDQALVRVHDARSSWSADTRILALWGNAEFMVPDNAHNWVLENVANVHRDAITDAVVGGTLGAEITLAAGAEGETLDETLVYDDVEVVIDAAPDTGAVEVTLSSDTLDEGRTFVLNVDGEVLELGGGLDVSYYNVDEATGAAVEAEITEAASLTDVLDPSDDAGPEYWIVEDEDGVQVLASVNEWSVHKIRVQSAGGVDEGAPFWTPAPGIVLVAVGALVGAVAVRRRRLA